MLCLGTVKLCMREKKAWHQVYHDQVSDVLSIVCVELKE